MKTALSATYNAFDRNPPTISKVRNTPLGNFSNEDDDGNANGKKAIGLY